MSDVGRLAAVDSAVQHCCRVLNKARCGAGLLPTRAADVHVAMRGGALDLPALLASQECLLVIFDEHSEMGADTSQVVEDARSIGVSAIFVQPVNASMIKAQAARLLREAAGADPRIFTYEAGSVAEVVEAALLRAVSFPAVRAGGSSQPLKEYPAV